MRILDLAQVRELMRATQERARQEPGCVYYAFAEALDEPGRFVVVQQWRDRAALEEHYKTGSFIDYQTNISQHLVRSSELTIHEVSASLHPVGSALLDGAQDD